MTIVRSCRLYDLRILVENNSIESTVIEVNSEKMHRCYFMVREAKALVRYNLATDRSEKPRRFKNPGTISRILKKENIHRWRVVNVDQE